MFLNPSLPQAHCTHTKAARAREWEFLITWGCHIGLTCLFIVSLASLIQSQPFLGPQRRILLLLSNDGPLGWFTIGLWNLHSLWPRLLELEKSLEARFGEEAVVSSIQERKAENQLSESCFFPIHNGDSLEGMMVCWGHGSPISQMSP